MSRYHAQQDGYARPNTRADVDLDDLYSDIIGGMGDSAISHHPTHAHSQHDRAHPGAYKPDTRTYDPNQQSQHASQTQQLTRYTLTDSYAGEPQQHTPHRHVSEPILPQHHPPAVPATPDQPLASASLTRHRAVHSKDGGSLNRRGLPSSPGEKAERWKPPAERRGGTVGVRQLPAPPGSPGPPPVASSSSSGAYGGGYEGGNGFPTALQEKQGYLASIPQDRPASPVHTDYYTQFQPSALTSHAAGPSTSPRPSPPPPPPPPPPPAMSHSHSQPYGVATHAPHLQPQHSYAGPNHPNRVSSPAGSISERQTTGPPSLYTSNSTATSHSASTEYPVSYQSSPSYTGNGFQDDPNFGGGATLQPPKSRPGSGSSPKDLRMTMGRHSSSSTIGSYLPVSEQASPLPQHTTFSSSSSYPQQPSPSNQQVFDQYAQSPVSYLHQDPSMQQQQQSSGAPQQDADRARAEKERIRFELQGYQNPEDDSYLDDGSEEGYEDGVSRFFTPALLSNVSVQLRDKVVRGDHVKGSIPFPNSFTGKDIVSAIQTFIPPTLRTSPQDRRAALEVARSLKSQLYFIEVDFDDMPLTDSMDDVFTFMDESEAGAGGGFTELPTGVFTLLTKCYSPSCTGDGGCYSPRCPFKITDNFLTRNQSTISVRDQPRQRKRTWAEAVDPAVLMSLSQSEVNRQEAIHTTILQEEQYREDLLTIETLFILPLRAADPPIVFPPEKLEKFIADVFTNISAIRAANERLLELFIVRQREQAPTIDTIGDIFLHAASEYRSIYAEYLSKQPAAEVALEQGMAAFPELRTFVERAAHTPEARGRDLKRFLGRPAAQLHRYHKLLDAILKETRPDQVDCEFIAEADAAISKFAIEGKLLGFQAGTGRGVHDGMGWESFVSKEELEKIPKATQQRQHVIFEVIKGEIEYVSDLRAIDTLFVTAIREARPPVIGAERMEPFIAEVFGNYREILAIHENLLARFCKRQRDQHPCIASVTDLIFDALLQWGDAYRNYAANYPIAKWKIDKEKRDNPAFADFFERAIRHQLAYRNDMYHFVNRPIPRLLRYDLLLKEVSKLSKKEGLPTDEIEQVQTELAASAALTDKAVQEAQEKIEMWQLKDTLATPSDARFGDSCIADLELMDPKRQIIHKGYLRQPDNVQVYVLLFDNYLVTTRVMKVREGKKEEGQQKHVIQKRPIPLSLLNLGDFTGALGRAPSNIGTGLIGRTKTTDSAAADNDSKIVFPFTYIVKSSGVMGGSYTLWADTDASRTEWRDKLQEAKTLSDVVADSNKVFELGLVSERTLFKSGSTVPQAAQSRSTDANPLAGQVTCSVPFRTRDRRELVAVGCEEGVWIGMKGNAASFSKVLHVKNVMQCAVLEEFSMFLVLADHSLFAYQLEALVPSSVPSQNPNTQRGPERLSGTAHVLFFSVGKLSNRTLVAYCKKKQLDSVFRVLEPIPLDARGDHGRRNFFGGGGQKGASFRVFKDFFIPSDAKLIHFLKAKLAIVCAKGFEIMDLANLQGGTIPIFFPQKIRENSAVASLAKRCEGATPLGMYRSTETEFLLCYSTFGFYVEKHGEPARDFRTIDWETSPKSVAFHPPHFLLFSWNFIEVRHIHTGKLVQIITGNDIRCVWDGSGVSNDQSTPGPSGYGAESATTEARIHVVMDDEKIAGKKGTPQVVHELQPTVLLDVPGQNGVGGYFPQQQQHGHPQQQQQYYPQQQQQQQGYSRNAQPQYYPQGLDFSRQQHQQAQNGGGQQQWR